MANIRVTGRIFTALIMFLMSCGFSGFSTAQEPLQTEYEWQLDDLPIERDFEISGLRLTDSITVGELKTPYHYSYGLMYEQPSAIWKFDLESIEFYFRF